jgi:uncharacterized protein (TIGR02284 family)
MSRDAAVTMLNRLTAVAHDGVEGFRLAAERAAGADDPQLRAMLTELATDRQAVVAALQEAVRGLGDEPETAGTLAGTAHRALVGLRAAVGAEVGRDELLADVERGEDDAVAHFERELAEGGGELPLDVRTLVEAQLTQLRRSRECVRTLRRGGGGAGS